MFESFTSSIEPPGMPVRMEPGMGALKHERLLISTRRIVPTFVLSFGPRRRAPRRIKIGPLYKSRMVVFVIVKSSSSAPSTLSNAYPRHPSKTQFEIVTLMNPPLDSVPHLIRPVYPECTSDGNFLKVPSSTVPSM